MPSKRPKARARAIAALTALKSQARLEKEIRSLEITIDKHWKALCKLCHHAWAEGVRSAPARDHRRYMLRAPGEGRGVYFMPAPGQPADKPKNLAEEQLGKILDDWFDKQRELGFSLAKLENEQLPRREVFRLVGEAFG